MAANVLLRAEMTARSPVDVVFPRPELCTDNAAMIAYAGGALFAAGTKHDMTLSARPRWPLDSAAAPLVGSGKKGAKA